MKIKAAFLLLLFFTFACSADVLLIERIDSKSGLSLPSTGQTMAKVKTGFGDPEMQYDAVGEPPITRWDYPGFSVYFEHQHVITTVLKKSSATEIGVKEQQ